MEDVNLEELQAEAAQEIKEDLVRQYKARVKQGLKHMASLQRQIKLLGDEIAVEQKNIKELTLESFETEMHPDGRRY